MSNYGPFDCMMDLDSFAVRVSRVSGSGTTYLDYVSLFYTPGVAPTATAIPATNTPIPATATATAVPGAITVYDFGAGSLPSGWVGGGTWRAILRWVVDFSTLL